MTPPRGAAASSKDLFHTHSFILPCREKGGECNPARVQRSQRMTRVRTVLGALLVALITLISTEDHLWPSPSASV